MKINTIILLFLWAMLAGTISLGFAVMGYEILGIVFLILSLTLATISVVVFTLLVAENTRSEE